jgi:glucokinase
MKKYGFGVDIGGTTCKIGFFETNGTLLDKWEIKTNTENGGASILDDVTASIQEKMEKDNIGRDDVQGVGVGVPGPVTGDGTVLQCVNLGWGVVNVAEELGNKCGFPVKVGNDANVAALGEMWQGGGKGYSNVVMVTLGTGVGGGIIVDGKIVAGARGAGGEIGHMMVNENETDTCGCGKKGCLEQYTSATGIVRMAKHRLAEDTQETVLRGIEPLTAKDIFDQAKAGDTVAAGMVEELGKVLGTALAGIACVVNPEVFVIGGGVSKAGSILLDVIEKYYMERTFHVCREAKFALASLGNDAGMYGCVQMILD